MTSIEQSGFHTISSAISMLRGFDRRTIHSSSRSSQDLSGQARRLQLQARALTDFFRDVDGQVHDFRILRSAMYLSDEIDRAVRGVDIPNSLIGYRPYNRFFAVGTEELFTNIPTGRSPLVLAAPKPELLSEAKMHFVGDDSSTPEQYRAMRRAMQVRPNSSSSSSANLSIDSDSALGTSYRRFGRRVIPQMDTNESHFLRPISVKSAIYQRYDANISMQRKSDPSSIRPRLLKFESDLHDRRPDLSL